MTFLLVSLAVLAFPSTALSAEVSLRGSQLQFLAEEGEQNAVEVRVILAAYEVTDFGTAVTAGAGCRSVGPNTARCPSALVTSVVVTTGDHSDSVDLASTLPEEAQSSVRVPSVIRTGPEYDRVMGGLAADAVEGGPGIDVLQGNEGDDTLRDGSGDGLTDGGPGADVLIGEEGNDALSGDAGEDRLHGGEGDDSLAGGAGSDLLEGASGNDALSARDGERDTLRCGSGIDGRVADLGLDTIACERRIQPPREDGATAHGGVGGGGSKNPKLRVRLKPRRTARTPKAVSAWIERVKSGRYSVRIGFVPKRIKPRRRCVSRFPKTVIARQRALRGADIATGIVLHRGCRR
jgi:Ca2+-binding RTX toxin-like protein